MKVLRWLHKKISRGNANFVEMSELHSNFDPGCYTISGWRTKDGDYITADGSILRCTLSDVATKIPTTIFTESWLGRYYRQMNERLRRAR